MLSADTALADPSDAAANPLAPRPQHHRAKAKSCIFLFMEGGVSQMDTFEYKPALWKYAGKQMPKAERTVGEIATFSAAPNRVIPPVLGLQAVRPVRPLDVRSAAASGHAVWTTWPSFTASRSTTTITVPPSITH